MVHEIIDANELEPGPNGRTKTILGGEGRSMTFLRTYLEPGQSSPAEDFVIHPDCDQIEYVLYGTGKAVYPDGTYPLYPGVSAYHSAGEPHRFDNDGDEPLIFLVATIVNDKESADRVMYDPEAE